MYEFARGPLVWIAFAVFVLGSLYRVLWAIVKARKEKVVFPYLNLGYGLRSIVHWIIPFGSKNMRMHPAFTVLSFLFHVCLIVTPIFLLAHIVLWEESWNVKWWSLPESMALAMTFALVVIGIILLLRRVADRTVRLVTTLSDYLFIIVVLSPFITGLLAYYQVFDYEMMLLCHIWTGAIWLMAIPFTRASHMLFFPLTRAYMGCEFGLVRNSKDW